MSDLDASSIDVNERGEVGILDCSTAAALETVENSREAESSDLICR